MLTYTSIYVNKEFEKNICAYIKTYRKTDIERGIISIFQRKELRQDADDMCMICFSEALCCAPVIMLKCGHIFHRQCTEDVIDRRWPGPRITFNFALCPICKVRITSATVAHSMKIHFDPVAN